MLFGNGSLTPGSAARAARAALQCADLVSCIRLLGSAERPSWVPNDAEIPAKRQHSSQGISSEGEDRLEPVDTESFEGPGGGSITQNCE